MFFHMVLVQSPVLKIVTLLLLVCQAGWWVG